MRKVDEEALICDLAETYGIFNYRSLPARMVATFACGLRDNSRIKLKLSGEPAPTDTILLARLVDLITMTLWSDDSSRPQSIVERLYNIEPEEKADKVTAFDEGKDFLEAWKILAQGGES